MKCLLLIDLQNDFCPGGALAVSSGDEVIAVANDLMPEYDLTIATQDWHPKNHLSFASNHENAKVGQVIELNGIKQLLWPDHCVAGSVGAEFHPMLNRSGIGYIQKKGSNQKIDSYSAFFENDLTTATGLDEYLKSRRINSLTVMGLATDYCVKYSVLDALRLGYFVKVFKKGCRAVNLKPQDEAAAYLSMKKAGAFLV